MCLVSKLEPRKHVNQNGTQNSATWSTSKIELFNCSLFGNSKTINGFVTSKRVQEWSQILIWCPGWLYTQNERTLIDNLALKSVIFEISPNIGELYVILNHFLPQVRIQGRYFSNH